MEEVTMKPIVKTTLFIEPKSKARPRGAIVGTGKKQHVKFYSDEATAQFEKRVAFLLKGYMSARGYEPCKLPVVMFVKFYLPNRRKIDVDNLLKATFDGANGVLYKDDCQVQAVYSSKHYDKERPRIEVQMHTQESFVKFHRKLLDEFIAEDIASFGQQ